MVHSANSFNCSLDKGSMGTFLDRSSFIRTCSRDRWEKNLSMILAPLKTVGSWSLISGIEETAKQANPEGSWVSRKFVDFEGSILPDGIKYDSKSHTR